MADQLRLIKKYPNRRLYDTRTSSYITLADVKELVLGNEDFQVIDAKTSEDLTRSILLQIILEEEAGGAPMFTSDLLAHYDPLLWQCMQGMMGKHLENNIKAFTDMQQNSRIRRSRSTEKTVPSARICGPSFSTSGAGHAKRNGRLHGTEQEDVPPRCRKRSRARRATCSRVSSSPTMFRARCARASACGRGVHFAGWRYQAGKRRQEVGSAGILARSGGPSTHCRIE